MTARESSHDIDQAAADWTARLDRAPLTPRENEALQAWLNGDPRHKGAFLRAQAVSMMSESAGALGSGFDPARFQNSEPSPPRMSRRRALAWAGGAITTGSLVALGISAPASGRVINTGRGEIRLVPLRDGSTVLLNTATRLRVDYGERERLVTLLEGEAYFSVTPDAMRPFVVAVGDRRLRAAQASFRVLKLSARPADILVHQGRVELASPRNAPPLVLTANTRLTLDGAGATGPIARPQPLSPEVVSRELAWREGKIAFEGETLQQAADAFARYSDRRIIIGDPALAREPVSGLFSANDPAGFGRAVARVFDARVEESAGAIVLSRDAALH